MDAPQRRLVFCWDPRLRQPCRPAAPEDPSLTDLVRDMLRIMAEERGVGLAAPQVGDDRRVLVIRRPEDPPEQSRVLINPELISASADRVPFEEGCLSFPGVYCTVWRPSTIKISYTDPGGDAKTLSDGGFLARVVQHEMDHLDGILFVDHLSGWQRFRVRVRMGFWRLGWR